MKPILFHGDMVRAILDGRKTQTRRVVKFEHAGEVDKWAFSTERGLWEMGVMGEGGPVASMGFIPCPYGAVGGKLWVRETWTELLHTSHATNEPLLCPGDKLIEHATQWEDSEGRKHWRYDGRVIAYRATSEVEFCDGDGFSGECANREDMPKWRPSIHMPRWASRITLEITDVRVQRLHEITEEDARAEGAYPPVAGTDDDGMHFDAGTYRDGFRSLWDSINSARGFGWDANPWVWAITFRRVQE